MSLLLGLSHGCCDSPLPRCPGTAPCSGSSWLPKSSPSSADGSRAGLEPASPGPGKEEALVQAADTEDQHHDQGAALTQQELWSAQRGPGFPEEGSWPPRTLQASRLVPARPVTRRSDWRALSHSNFSQKLVLKFSKIPTGREIHGLCPGKTEDTAWARHHAPRPILPAQGEPSSASAGTMG